MPGAYGPARYSLLMRFDDAVVAFLAFIGLMISAIMLGNFLHRVLPT